MPLILITGISTSGKSTIAKELINRDYEAYDTEHNDISAWYHKTTNKRIAEFGQIPERTKDWLSQHEWRISITWVKQMAQKAQDQNKFIFLCGGGANEPEVRALCSKVIWLKTDEQTIRQRVTYQRDHDYGTKPHELARIIAGNRQKEAEYREAGAAMVDATRSIGEVIGEVLSVL